MPRLLQPCGTWGAYQRHRKVGEAACVPCREAARTRAMEVRQCHECDETIRVRRDKPTQHCPDCARRVSARTRGGPTAKRPSPSTELVGPLQVSKLPDYSLRQARPGTWWTLIVQGPCSWCGESFTRLASSTTTAPRYCTDRCSRAAQRSRRGRFVVPPKVRAEVYERDGWVCQLCDDPVDRTLDPSDPWAATLDHVVPQSWVLVPDHRPSNLRLAHRWCNSVRGDETYHSGDVLRVG